MPSSSSKYSSEPSIREELLALVDQYDSSSLTDHPQLLKLSCLPQPEAGPHMVISDNAEDGYWQSPQFKPPAHVDQWKAAENQHLLEPPVLPQTEAGPHTPVSDNAEDCYSKSTKFKRSAHDEQRKAVERLEELLNHTNVRPEDSYKLYRELPAPRVPYLSSATRHKLLHNLGVLERKNEEAMLRYLSVVDDMRATGIPLTTSEWNCATSFVGRYVGRTTEVEVKTGLRLWKEM